MKMFARYAPPARRAIFFARAVTLYSAHDYIQPLDLLRGLIFEDNRAQTIFDLRDFFPIYRGLPLISADLHLNEKSGPPLDQASKQILRETAAEATGMGDYFIDTEHILVGILRVPDCDAAGYLSMIGLTVLAAREQIERDNKQSRRDYGPTPLSWRINRRLSKLVPFSKTL